MEALDTSDRPDLVVIQVYITNAYRAYRIADHYRAKGCFVALGGLHVTSLPDEAMPHADAIFLGRVNRLSPSSWTISALAAYKNSTGPRLADPRSSAADSSGSHRAPALPGTELHRYDTRLPSALRLLLQGCILHGRAFLLYAARGCCPRRNVAPAGTSFVLSGRPSARRPAIRGGFV